MKLRRICLFAVAALLAVAAAPLRPARAGPADEETGPNFEIPPDVPPAIVEKYKHALDQYTFAKKPQAGQTKKISAAIKEFTSTKNLAPKFAAPRYFLGVMYVWTMEYEKARDSLKSACDLNPSFHQAMVKLAEAYWRLKKPDKALAECERAIALAPKYGPAYTIRGVCRLKSGDAKGALEDFQQAKKLGEEHLEELLDMAKHEVDGPGWKETFTCETANYIVTTPVSQDLADDIGKHAELIRKTYTKIFPEIVKEKRKFPIIVYANDAEYHKNGGPPSAGGHYSSFMRKLYLFQYPEDKDTKLVLYHEGFHQFLDDYLDDAPQWFNEGLGDFFGPSLYIPPKKASMGAQGSMQLRPNPWRLKTIQAAIQVGKVRHFADLMLMSQEEMYQEEWAGIHYAEAWSIIYFLVRGGAPAGKEAGPYFHYLQDYFKALRRGDGRDTAFVAAFGNDEAAIQKLMKEWAKFTLDLREEP